jgi:3-hydroxyanthranilate 3,4-dioxygenase
MIPFNVLNLKQWVEENKELLKPPVNNKEIYPGGDFIVMVVGSPNERVDYHYNETAEFFYQIKGDISLKIVDDGEFKEIHIKEGEIFLLPAKVPHSPQRPEGTIGLVIEMKREPKHTDGFQWYCPNCGNKLFEEYFKLENIVKQLPETFAKFNGNEELHNCKKCGHKLDVPQKK